MVWQNVRYTNYRRRGPQEAVHLKAGARTGAKTSRFAMILRVVGAFLVINAIAYAAQFVFNDLYQDGQGLEPKHIW